MLAVATPGLPGSYGLGGGGPRIGAGGGAGRIARGADSVRIGGARRTVVELGSGYHFQNIPTIVADNPGARVIGIERLEAELFIREGLRRPGDPMFDEMVKAHKRADDEEGAEIWFMDYTTDALPANLADEVISIAPQPGKEGFFGATPTQTADAIARTVKPGGRVYVASDNRYAAKVIGDRFGVKYRTVSRSIVPYKSSFLDKNVFGESYIIDLRVP